MIMLTTQNLTLHIASHIVCQNLSLTFKAGEFWALMGLNGRGKTTLLKALHALHPVHKGSIYLNQRLLSDYSRFTLAKHIGFLLQNYDYPFPGSVLNTVLTGRYPHIPTWQWESQHDYEMAYQALQTVNMQHFTERTIDTLSGGEKRRIHIATLLAQNPDYYLLDEPIHSLDMKAQMDILTLFQSECREKNKCAIMSIHDPNLAWRFCDHSLLLLADGTQIAGKTQDIMTPFTLEALFQYPIKVFKQDNSVFFTA